MKKWLFLKHASIRIAILIAGTFISAMIGLSLLDSNRKCGTGDAFAIMGFVLIFYIIWSIGLSIEAFILHRKQELKLRNLNLIMVLVLPTLLFLLYLYFEIIQLFD